MALTRDQILGKVDIKTKPLHVPEWGGEIFIRQLTRAEQDEYLKRQYSETRLKQDSRAKKQEFNIDGVFGHDAFICVCGVCDEDAKPLFRREDMEALKKKNGAVVGRIAVEILKFSDMEEDVLLEDEVKNS